MLFDNYFMARSTCGQDKSKPVLKASQVASRQDVVSCPLEVTYMYMVVSCKKSIFFKQTKSSNDLLYNCGLFGQDG